MITPNMHYRDLKESYLFAGIAQKVKKYQMEHPEKHIYRMGIGDVSLPLCDAVIAALHEGVADQANKETFHGYMPECGAQFLRETVAKHYWIPTRCSYRVEQVMSWEIFSISLTEAARHSSLNPHIPPT